MYQIGEAVKDKFGSMIAFAKLREAFLDAGGKLGKRGRKPGSKNRPKAAKATKAKAKKSDGRRGPRGNTKEKQALVAKLVKSKENSTHRIVPIQANSHKK